jgi:cytochrome c-type biogenesis protein CcmF
VTAAVAGSIGIVLGLLGGVMVTAGGIASARHRSPDERLLRAGIRLLTVGTLAVFVALETALVTDDFSLRYVAEHGARETPLVFKLTTGWSALEGSIVLWVLVLTGCIVVVGRQHRRIHDDALGAGALAVLGAIGVFFFGLLLTGAYPFELLRVAVPDGPGVNPLLQNNLLVTVHPPLLYLGYVGLSVPFAFAVSALAQGIRGPSWVLRTRRWALLAWAFLTAGIVAGAWWSYAVLGWGGYWAWDPVENASFMPWLLATAYIHSALVHARRGMLRAWSTALVLATFSLTILGTFLTRSGVIGSVHSFTQSSVGPALLTFLVVTTVASFALFAARAHLLTSGPALDALVSREGSFLLNNLLLTVLALTVLTGTLYPIINEAVSGEQVSVGAPFFNTMAVPLALILLLAMGIGPLLSPTSRAGGARTELATIRTPLRIGLAAGALAVLAGMRGPAMILVVVLGAVVVAGIATTFGHELGPASAGPWHRRAAAVFLRRPGYWCGQVAHVGIVIVAVGIAASSSFAIRDTVLLRSGSEARVGSYSLRLLDNFTKPEPNRTVSGVRVRVSGPGGTRTMAPALRHYTAVDDTVSTPAIWTTWRGDDVYLSITRLHRGDITMNVFVLPFVSLIWIGGGLVAASALVSVALWRWQRQRDTRVAASTGELANV